MYTHTHTHTHIWFFFSPLPLSFSEQIRYWYLGSLTCGLIPATMVWTKKQGIWIIWLKKFCEARRFNGLTWHIWVSSEQMHTRQFGWERRMLWQYGVRTACTGAYLVSLTHGLISCRNWSIIAWRWDEHWKGCINLKIETANISTHDSWPRSKKWVSRSKWEAGGNVNRDLNDVRALWWVKAYFSFYLWQEVTRFRCRIVTRK